MNTVAATPVAADPGDSRVVLRDGTVATLRVTRSSDHDALRRFFHELSPESRGRRFFTLSDPAEALIDTFCDSGNPGRQATLVALRQVAGGLRPVAVGSYLELRDGVAEAAFAVGDAFQGKGLGTILLERLATMAAASGFRTFEATVLPDNHAMLEVFRDSGFEISSKSDRDAVTILLSLSPTEGSVAAAGRRQALATATSLGPLLAPSAVAVVGVSRDSGSVGRRILDAIVGGGFSGPVYPINPHVADIEGRRCYASVAEAPRGTDVAIIAVPAPLVLGVVAQCAAVGVKSLIVITAGFAEMGGEGSALQQELVDLVRGNGMRMVGPNCMGLLNTAAGVTLNASFSPIVPPAGRIAFSSQSGALGMAILRLAIDRGVGLSAFVSVGNKADVSSNDLLEYWEADPGTAVILLYLESFGNPRRFAQIARRIGRTKPIVAVKAGRTQAGLRAASSHTAALAASDATVDALFHQAGVIRADSIDALFDIATCLEAQPLPRGLRVAIVTNAGGPGILAVDACEAAGLTVAPFTEGTRARLSAFLPKEASVGNPVDIIASAAPDVFRQAIEVALTSDDTDALIVIFTPVDPRTSSQTLQAISDGIAGGRRAGATHKPVLGCLMAGDGRPLPLDLQTERIPVYAFPENAAGALGKAAAYGRWRAKPPALPWSFEDIRPDEARGVCRHALDTRGDGWLSSDEVRAVLAAFGLSLASGTLAHSEDEAAAAARAIGFPVAAKLASRAVTHKTDAGGVQLNLADEPAVRRAFDEILARGRSLAADADIDGVLIQTMVSGGVETVVGVTADPLFGPLVAFGLGGIHVEVLGDVQFALAPLTDRDADELLHGIRGLPLLLGYRGRAPADLDALRTILHRVSRLAADVPEIAELDLNPVIALAPGQGCRLVDARVKVRTIA